MFLRFFVFLTGLLGPVASLWAQPTFTIAVTPNQPVICSNGPGVQLSAAVTGGTPVAPVSFVWSPATGLSQDTIPNPLANPAVTTTYFVIATDANGDTANATVQVIVYDPPAATIVPPGDQCLGVPVNFSLANLQAGDSVTWDFGAGASPSGSNDSLPPPVTYAAPGLQTVVLLTSNPGCGTFLDSATFVVHTVQAAFTADSFGCTGGLVFFSDQSSTTDTLQSWLWDFGDGTQAAVAAPAHLYSSAGSYPVSLTVTTQSGCVDTAGATLDIFDFPTAAFGDSLVDCQTVIYTNQTPFAAYFWDFGDSTFSVQTSPVHTYQDTGVFTTLLIASNLCGTDSATATYYIGPECVWPGDANNDLIANNVDILSLGLLFGASGPARPGASLDWQAQGAPHWGLDLPGSGGLDAAFSDTDGDGVIGAADTLAIALNYGLTHNKHQGISQTGPLLYFDTTGLSLPVPVGSQVTLPVMLGTPDAPADSSYGLAFTIAYEPELVDSASAALSAPVSWLGSNLLTFARDFYADGALPAAITRTDQLMVPGAGQVAQFTFVMIDDIARLSGEDTLDLDFGDIILVDARGQPIPVQRLPARIPVTENTNHLDTGAAPAFRIYPNPSTGPLTVSGQTGQAVTVTLLDLRGRALRPPQAGHLPLHLNWAAYPAGSYLIQVDSRLGRQVELVQKVAP